MPEVQCIVGARPYRKSLASIVQQMGRGMRIANGKDYCLYLDHARNVERWFEDICDIWENGVSELPDGKAKKKKNNRIHKPKEPLICKCGYMVSPGTAPTNCPMCGEPFHFRKTSTVGEGTPAEMRLATRGRGGRIKEEWANEPELATVSYTHLTLPTICSV